MGVVKDAAERSVATMVRAIRTDEGVELLVRRLFPQEQVPMIDPFLLLDEAGPQLEGGRADCAGYLEHAHAGFTALTYVVAGASWEAADAIGNYDVQEAGSVSWLTTGSGTVHVERVTNPVRKQGGPSHAFQLWLDLPNAEKHCDPTHRYIQPADVPETTTDGARVRVLSGEALGLRAEGTSPTPLLYVHATIDPGASVTIPTSEGSNAIVYPFAGVVGVGNLDIPAEHFAILGSGDTVRLTVNGAASGPGDALLLAARPHGEPMVRVGPFSGVDMSDIGKAFAGWQSGAFGSVPL